MNKVWTPYSLDMCCIFTNRKKMNNVCIFSHVQVTHGIAVIQRNSNDSNGAIWADIDIRLIVKITAQEREKRLVWYVTPTRIQQAHVPLIAQKWQCYKQPKTRYLNVKHWCMWLACSKHCISGTQKCPWKLRTYIFRCHIFYKLEVCLGPRSVLNPVPCYLQVVRGYSEV